MIIILQPNPVQAIYAGSTISPSATFKNPNTNAAVDPNTVTLHVKAPSGTLTVYTYPATITRDGQGIYTKYDLLLTESGTWEGTWNATIGSAVVKQVFQFIVDPDPVG